MAIFGHSEFIPVFLGKLSEKNWNSHFWPFQILPVFLGKIVRKNLEWPFLAIPNLYQSFWEKSLDKIHDTSTMQDAVHKSYLLICVASTLQDMHIVSSTPTIQDAVSVQCIHTSRYVKTITQVYCEGPKRKLPQWLRANYEATITTTISLVMPFITLSELNSEQCLSKPNYQ